MLSVSYAGKNAYSAGKTSGVLRGVPLELIGAMCSPTAGGGGRILIKFLKDNQGLKYLSQEV